MGIDAAVIGARGEVGSATAVTTGGGTSSASGSTFVIAVAFNGGVAFGATPVSDSKSLTWTQIGTTQTTSTPDLSVAMFRASGAGGASHTGTANFASAVSADIFLVEITGAASPAFDQTAQGNDTTDPYTLTSPTLSQAAELVLTLVGCDTGTNFAWSSSNTTILDSQPSGAVGWPCAVSKLIVASTSAVTPSFSRSGDSSHASPLILATFKEAAVATQIEDTLHRPAVMAILAM